MVFPLLFFLHIRPGKRQVAEPRDLPSPRKKKETLVGGFKGKSAWGWLETSVLQAFARPGSVPKSQPLHAHLTPIQQAAQTSKQATHGDGRTLIFANPRRNRAGILQNSMRRVATKPRASPMKLPGVLDPLPRMRLPVQCHRILCRTVRRETERRAFSSCAHVLCAAPPSRLPTQPSSDQPS